MREEMLLLALWKALQKAKMTLSLETYIPDMAAYADAWNYLAAEYRALGATENEAYCLARWQHYKDMDPGAYVRHVQSWGLSLDLAPEILQLDPAALAGPDPVQSNLSASSIVPQFVEAS